MIAGPPPFPEPVYVTRPLRPPMAEFTALLEKIWTTARFSNGGALHEELEARLRDHLAVPHLSIWSNGTTALLGACRALGLRGEVITTPFTFPATVHALAWMGIEPVFADIDAHSLCLAADAVEHSITPRTSAILAVHVYGTPCDVGGLAAVAGRHRLTLLFDAAHAFGATIEGTTIGNFGDASVFSFHATKLFHTGEGAAVATGDAELARCLTLIRNFGIAGEVQIPVIGINGKLDELRAALGLCLLPMVEDEARARRALVERYEHGLSGLPGVEILKSTHRGGIDQYLVVCIRGDRTGIPRDAVLAGLRRHNVYARRYFHPLVSELPPYRSLPSADRKLLPNAHRAAGQCLTLPLYGELGAADVDQICAILHWIMGTAGQ
jgi:dTDP-4-amino-4,6-dideoxygalactose transaminase